MSFGDVISAASNINTLIDFILGGALAQSLTAIGEVQFRSAALALRNAKISQNPKREVELAVGHLQTAHIAYRKIWDRNTLRRNLQYNDVQRAFHFDQASNVWMAMCYCYLREKTLMRQAIQRAKDCVVYHDRWQDEGLWGIAFLNPVHLVSWSDDWSDVWTFCYKGDLDELLSALERV